MSERDDDERHQPQRRGQRGPLERPERVHAFVVGNNSEWETERDSVGDIALYQALQQVIGHVCFIKDAPTLDLIQEQFESFLQIAAQSCCEAIIVYCGGHGELQGLYISQDDQLWVYDDILDRIEASSFAKSRRSVLMLVDCCHSGNFAHRLAARQDKNRCNCSYLAIMSTLATDAAGPEWTLTSCIIDAIRGAATVDIDQDGHITLRDLVAYTTDCIFEIKGDVATVHSTSNERIDPDSLFLSGSVAHEETPAWNTHENSGCDDDSCSYSSSSWSDSSWKQPTLKTIYKLASNTFYYRWNGGFVANGNCRVYIYPAWLPATLILEKCSANTETTIRLTAPAYEHLSWNVLANCDDLWYYSETAHRPQCTCIPCWWTLCNWMQTMQSRRREQQ
jgi:hypothetical protein